MLTAVLGFWLDWRSAKHLPLFLTLRALAVTPTLSRYLSRWVKSRDYSDEEFMRADGADARWAQLRKQALNRLAEGFQAQCPKSIAWGKRYGRASPTCASPTPIGCLFPSCA